MIDEGQRLAELSEAVRESTLKRLRAVPEGLENWRPVPSAMSFADLAHHIAEAARWLFRKLESPELPPMRGEAGACVVADRAQFLALVEELADLGRRRSALLRTTASAARSRSGGSSSAATSTTKPTTAASSPPTCAKSPKPSG